MKPDKACRLSHGLAHRYLPFVTVFSCFAPHATLFQFHANCIRASRFFSSLSVLSSLVLLPVMGAPLVCHGWYATAQAACPCSRLTRLYVGTEAQASWQPVVLDSTSVLSLTMGTSPSPSETDVSFTALPRAIEESLALATRAERREARRSAASA